MRSLLKVSAVLILTVMVSALVLSTHRGGDGTAMRDDARSGRHGRTWNVSHPPLRHTGSLVPGVSSEPAVPVTTTVPDMAYMRGSETADNKPAITAPQERAGADEGALVVRPTAPAAPWLPDWPTECTGHVVAPEILMRESGCRYDAYNPSGCSGRGCVGLYQLDEGHFAAVSPWNPNVSGSCYGLSFSPADQDECASRLGPSAWAA